MWQSHLIHTRLPYVTFRPLLVHWLFMNSLPEKCYIYLYSHKAVNSVSSKPVFVFNEMQFAHKKKSLVYTTPLCTIIQILKKKKKTLIWYKWVSMLVPAWALLLFFKTLTSKEKWSSLSFWSLCPLWIPTKALNPAPYILLSMVLLFPFLLFFYTSLFLASLLCY